jgi:hypothetical protein
MSSYSNNTISRKYYSEAIAIIINVEKHYDLRRKILESSTQGELFPRGLNSRTLQVRVGANTPQA